MPQVNAWALKKLGPAVLSTLGVKDFIFEIIITETTLPASAGIRPVKTERVDPHV